MRPANNSLQRTAFRAAAEVERWAINHRTAIHRKSTARSTLSPRLIHFPATFCLQLVPEALACEGLVLEAFGAKQTLKVELLDGTFRFGLERTDQTLTSVGECAIEMVLRKWTETDLDRGGHWTARKECQSRKLDQIQRLKPLKDFLPTDAVEQERHLREDTWLYQAGDPRYICSILGAIYEEVERDRPDLLPLLLECVWISRRMNDTGKHQRDIWP